MKRSDCLSELVIRSRRYRLSEEDQRRLDQHLVVCSSCRLEQHVGADFDEICGLRAGDDVLVASLADKVVRRRLGLRGGRARPRALWMAGAAACVFFAAAAAAGVLLNHRIPVAPATPPTSMTTTAAPSQPNVRGRAHAVARAEPPVPAVETPVVADIAAPEPRRPVRVSARVRAATPAPTAVESPEVSADTAASLFSSANGERRRNQTASAIALYEDLQSRFPRSEEARISHVSLGRLLLDRSMWAEGLAQLDEYLSETPDGMLAPEALFGKARALEMLGRLEEERSQWTTLLTKFPDSVYAAQARRRMDEIRY